LNPPARNPSYGYSGVLRDTTICIYLLLLPGCSYIPVLNTSETLFFGTVNYRLNITLMHQ
jgi:hypothetical protein